MIKQPFIYTDHGLKRLKEFFPNLSNTEAVTSLSNCTSAEISRLKNTKAFKNVPNGKKNKFHYYKNEDGAYFVCEAKLQKNNEYSNVIITVIDLLSDEPSFITNDFRQMMIIAAYELEQKNKLEQTSNISTPNTKVKKSKNRKRNKNKKTKKEFFNHPIDTQIGILERGIYNLNKNEFFKNIDLKIEDFDLENNKMDYNNSCLYLINKETESIQSFNKKLNQFILNRKQPTTKHIGVLASNLLFDLINKDFNFELKGIDKLKNGIFSLIKEALSLKTKAIESFYTGSGSFSYLQYKKFYNFAELFNNLNIDQDNILSEFLSVVIPFHINIELNRVYKEDSLLTKARLLDNINELSFFTENLVDNSHLVKINGIQSFYGSVISQMDELEEDSFYIKDYL